jgi:penicillin-binding protein-related factor A (putative recombinase)
MTENKFNAKLSQYLRKTKTHYVKVSDRTTVGISDFLIWHEGMSVALETKRIPCLPCKDTARILGHPFSRPQIRFLKNMILSGNLGYGLIAVDSEKTMYLIPTDEIPESGNWALDDFKSKLPGFQKFNTNDFKGLFKGMFYSDEQIRRIV